jgi:hypothetical protein
MFPIFAGNSASTGYNLTRSLRFRASASASLSRTPSVAGNRQIFTYSAWIKRGTINASFTNLLYTYVSTSDVSYISINASYQLTIGTYNGGSFVGELVSTQVFRDPSAWYHIVVAVDTTQATASNRMKMYVNGSQITALATATYPPQNTNFYFNAQYITRIAASDYPSAPNYFDGYIAELNWIDGQQLTPSSFGSTNATTGVWQPARYTGTYGTNGFYLPFTDNSALTTSSNVGLGKDFSGNGNYWVTNNISVTAGVTYDSMTDVPTLTSATTANFCVANPLDKQTDIAVAQGNLQISTTAGAGNKQIRGSIALPSTGKFYWETRNTGSVNNFSMGVTTTTASLSTEGAGDVLYNENGIINNNGTTTSGFATLALNDIVGVAVDVDANKIYFYKNNTLVNSGGTTINISAPFAPMFGLYDNGNAQSITFGQRPFTYTAPSGFVALNTYNLPTSTIVKGNTVFDATLYTGNGSTQTITNAAGFRPDLVWDKRRDAAGNHGLFDSVRGGGNWISSNATNAETAGVNGVTAFNSNGFSVGSHPDYNTTAATQVAWQWQAGQGTTNSNTSGTVTSQVSVNASAGFSICTLTTPASGTCTFGHSLGVAPLLVITKYRSSTSDWVSYHASVGNTVYLLLNTTAAATTNTNTWNNTSPTSSVVTLGSDFSGNRTIVAYCWTPIAGYSAFGSYTGNGSTDGPFVYTGFRPKFLILKSATNGAYGWTMWDSARNTYNVVDKFLQANGSAAEGTFGVPDFLANGFKIRTSDVSVNENGGTMIYMAFAENPFRNSLAR